MNICIWRGTALRGVYQSGCSDEPKMTGVPPEKGSDCPYCGRAYVMETPPKRGAGPTPAEPR